MDYRLKNWEEEVARFRTINCQRHASNEQWKDRKKNTNFSKGDKVWFTYQRKHILTTRPVYDHTVPALVLRRSWIPWRKQYKIMRFDIGELYALADWHQLKKVED